MRKRTEQTRSSGMIRQMAGQQSDRRITNNFMMKAGRLHIDGRHSNGCRIDNIVAIEEKVGWNY